MVSVCMCVLQVGDHRTCAHTKATVPVPVIVVVVVVTVSRGQSNACTAPSCARTAAADELAATPIVFFFN